MADHNSGKRPQNRDAMADHNSGKRSQKRGNRAGREQPNASGNRARGDARVCQHNRLSVNSSCPQCFPGLGNAPAAPAPASNPAADEAWAPSPSSFPPLRRPLPEASGVQRIVSSDLVELPLVLCNSDGTEKQALQAVRCCRDDTLLDIRSMLAAGVDPNPLPENFSFLKDVGGRILKLSREQETGRKAYKAKHFASKKQKHQLRICLDDDDYEIVRLKRSGAQDEDGIVEFCVRHLRMSDDDHRGEASRTLGMCRLHRDLPLRDVRRQLSEQLPEAPARTGSFVRMLGEDVTLVSPEQEDPGCRNPLLARHFLPPYTSRPELILMTPRVCTEGEGVPDETKRRELKSLASPLLRHGKNPRDVVKEKATAYINAFLNTEGGVLIFGVNDDGVVERVPIAGSKDSAELSMDRRVKVARCAKDDIRKLIDEYARGMDPAVDSDLVTTQFVPVRRNSNGYTVLDDQTREAEDEIYCVIEVHCKVGRQPVYFMDKHSFDAYERRDGATFLMDKAAIMLSLNSSTAARSDNIAGNVGARWGGGWRQVQSAFDFNALMRRLSDPWAGREWLFASVRRSLFEIVGAEHEEPRAPHCWGVGIVGSRGMGKTAFLSELSLRPKNVSGVKVVAHHLCRMDDPDTLNPALFVQSIAAMLSLNCKEFRSLMVQSPSNGCEIDPIGMAMLRALHPDHCESDPDDAFVRGILKPLCHIDATRRSKRKQSPISLPMIVVIDALDECLSVPSERRPGRTGSISVAHLLERAVSGGRNLPSWIKFVISFRSEIVDIPGPIERLRKRMKLIDLDPDSDSYDSSKLHQYRTDIRLFIQAYIERTRMLSPLGSIGSGKWDFTMAAKFANELERQNGRDVYGWEYLKSGQWKPFDEIQNTDLLYAHNTGETYCFYSQGRDTFRADLQIMNQTSLKSLVEHSLRMVKIDSSGDRVPCAIGDVSWDHGDQVLETQDDDASVLLNGLALNSQGNYQYARTVLEEIRSGRLEWGQVESIPQGLDLLYDLFFRSLGTSEASGTRPSARVVRPVLEVLLAAPKCGLTERVIVHSVIAGGACDPAAVIFCLRDIRWAIDTESSHNRLRYSLRHESIRSFLREGGGMEHPLRCCEANGHMMLAASLLQRCWPQQTALSIWMRKGTIETASPMDWYNWSDWAPNSEEGDNVYNLALHLSLCDVGSEEERISLLRTIGQDLLDSAFLGKGTALHAAAFSGIVPVVKILLGAGASPSVVARGRTPLHYAAGKGYSVTVSLLLSAGADVTLATPNNRTPLICAASRGSPTTIKCILRAILATSNASDAESDSGGVRDMLNSSLIDSGRTALSLAAEEGHDEVIQLLLEAGASATLADRQGRTPLYYASRFGRVGPEVIHALVNANGGADAMGWGEAQHLRSPLHAASRHGHLHVVQALLECGADPSIVESRNGWSSLHEASCLGNYGHQQKNRTGTPDTDEESKRLEILHLLLDNQRCAIDLGDFSGCTALWHAAANGWTNSVKILLDHSACVDPGGIASLPGKTKRGPASPLLLALKRRHVETATLLIERGATLPPEYELDCHWEAPGILLELLQRLATEDKKPVDTSSVIDYSMAVPCEAVPNDEYAQR